MQWQKLLMHNKVKCKAHYVKAHLDLLIIFVIYSHQASCTVMRHCDVGVIGSSRSDDYYKVKVSHTQHNNRTTVLMLTILWAHCSVKLHFLTVQINVYGMRKLMQALVTPQYCRKLKEQLIIISIIPCQILIIKVGVVVMFLLIT